MKSFSKLFVIFVIILSAVPANAQSWPAGDLDGNYKVDCNDLKLFAQQWLDPSGCSGLGCADFDGKDGVNFKDFAALAKNWDKKLLFLNEIMASNDTTFEDPQEPGEYPDWIEIYNASDQTVDLGGLYLTDNEDIPNKFQIPTGVSVDANSFIVFIADHEPEQGSKHTNFKIKADGDDIYIFAQYTDIPIDSVVFDTQDTDISYGRYPDGNDNWQYMGYPTPGAKNNGDLLGKVADTKFSVDRGFYNPPFQVRIATDTDGATIRYTIDGRDPVEPNGLVYNDNSPIQITKSTCLRAAAYKAGWLPSNTDTQTYICLNDAINQPATKPGPEWPNPGNWYGQTIDYQMDPDVTTNPTYASLMDDALLAIPSICIGTDLKNLFDPDVGIYVNCGGYTGERGPQWERPVSFELINPDGSTAFHINGGLRMRGITSCSGGNPKHAFRMFFRPEYGGTLNYPLFGDEGAEEFETVDLRCEANYSWNNDGSSSNQYHTAVREVFCRDLQRQMGEPYTRSRYYHLYINGVYWGLYQTQERAEASYAERYFGGDKEEYDVVKTNQNWPRSVEATDGSLDAYKRLWQACLTGFETDLKYFKVQGQNTDGTPNPAYERLVDVNNLIDYMITIYYTGDFDAPITAWDSDQAPNNFYGVYSRIQPDGFKYFRHDGEHTLGVWHDLGVNRVGPLENPNLMNFDTNCVPTMYVWPTCIGFNPQTIHQYLIVHPEYKLKFADHVHKFLFNDGTMTITKAQELFDSRAAEIDLAIIAESARWGDAQQASPRTKSDWLAEINWVENTYMTTRTDITIDQLKNVSGAWYPAVDAPIFHINGVAQHGGLLPSPPDSLTMTATAGTIYYTLDGTDPRTPLTGVPRGTTYGGAISLTQPTKVMARAYSSSTWSALSEAVYDINAVKNNLRITEIMYHPQDTGNPNDPNTEFIELKNIGTSSLNLRWSKFTEGIHFTFPNVTLAAGGHIVVVKNTAAFTAKYGSGINIAGQYTGSLDNAGERIKLEDAIGRTVLDFKYQNGWCDITDGGGYSLTINNASNSDTNSWAKQDSWSPSTYLGGTPAYGDSGPKWGDVVINEVLAHQDASPEDWIELHNTTGSPINITGWFLSDSDSNLTKYQIPSATIPANGYIVFTEDNHFGSYFALSENGDQVYLTGKKDANSHLTGYRQKEEFGASELGVAFGRYYKVSINNFDFVAMSQNTPGASYQGAPNAYPKVGPIIISEIMYRPDKFWGNWKAEYIELYNTSGSTVNLYDANGVRWKFTDGIEYTLPAGTSLASHSYLLVVKNLIAFNAEFPGVSVQKLQWTSGKLNDDGEKVEISMPGDIDEYGQQQYIRIDHVNYSDGSHPENFNGVTDPWPVLANGLGYSLTRLNYNNYGNDPNNWTAYPPSPGQAGSPPTPPSKATNPSPPSGAILQPTTITLTWSNGGGATSYDVYFGTDSTPDETEFKFNTSGTSYSPPSLNALTTYYWRIDAKNPAYTTTGDVWSFTTEGSSLLVDLNAKNLTLGTLSSWTNNGTAGGNFTNEGTTPTVEVVGSTKAVSFDGSTDKMKSSFLAPSSLSANKPFTVAVWAYNPAISDEECMVNWSHRGGPAGTCAQLNFGNNATWGAVTHWDTPDMGFDGGIPTSGVWHHIAVTFDGTTEKVYVDGAQNAIETKTLNLYSGDPIYLGCAGGNDKWFSGSIASVKIYNYTLTATQIALLSKETPGWTMLTYDDFESGFGNYTDGGANCWLYSYATGTNLAHQGFKAADIEANAGDASSFYYTNSINVDTPGYTQIKVDFWYLAYDLEPNEKFYVEYWNGSAWQIVATYTAGVDFVADDITRTFYHPTITLNEGTYTFPAAMRLKFRCAASSTDDDVYIDEVRALAQ